MRGRVRIREREVSEDYKRTGATAVRTLKDAAATKPGHDSTASGTIVTGTAASSATTKPV